MESGVFLDSLGAKNRLFFSSRLLNSSLLASTRPLSLSCLPLICQRKQNRRLVAEKVVSFPNGSSRLNASRDDYVLVSIAECSDGSMIFRFGDEDDIAKNTEMERQRLLLHKDTGHEVNDKQTGVGICEDIQRESPLGQLQTETKSVTIVSDDHVTNDFELETTAGILVPTLEATLDRGEPSVETISYKVLTPSNQSTIDDVRQGEISCDDIEVTAASMDSGLNIVHSEEVPREDCKGELMTHVASPMSSSSVQLLENLASDGNNLSSSTKDVHVSQSSEECQANTETSSVDHYDADSNDNVIQVVPESTLTQVESTSIEELPQASMDVLMENRSESLMLDAKASSSTCVENSSKADASRADGWHLQAGGSCNNREENLMADLVLFSGAASLPHPLKALAGGEDFYFVDQSWLGIADGAGQWSFEGTSASLYAQELIKNCEKIVSESKSTPVMDPADVLCKAVARTQSCGLSTALVAFFNGEALLVAHVGNSGFVIIRDGNVFERSSPMVYEFNFPVQIEDGDDPSELIKGYKLDLEQGDIIIFATNGLFDNLYEQDIASIVSRSLETNSTPQQIAELLTMRAYEVGQMASGRTPFADAAQAAGYPGLTGGKLDDITVIVSLVQNRASSCLQ